MLHSLRVPCAGHFAPVVSVRGSQSCLCTEKVGREGGIVRIVSVLAVMGEDLRRVPPLLSRLQADWMPEFAEALSCISAANRQVHSPPDLVADLYRSQQDECAVGGGALLTLVTSCFSSLSLRTLMLMKTNVSPASLRLRAVFSADVGPVCVCVVSSHRYHANTRHRPGSVRRRHVGF